MFTKILVPLDGSDKSFEALEATYDMAKKFDAEVFLLSVFKHYGFMEGSLSMHKRNSGPENLEDVLRDYSKDIVSEAKKVLQEKGLTRIRGFVKMGSAAKEILKFSKAHKIDLIVIGSKGQGELSGYLLGGVSHKVTGLSKCPVLVI